jgi:protocatechuate 3,4-dioxygenase beta subunit
MAHDPDHDDFGGLSRDLKATLERGRRRDFLKWIAGASLVPLVGACASDGESLVDAGTTTGTDGASGACAVIPTETGGPYPADGTNGPNVLTTSGVVRSDITTSFGGLTGTAAGVPLTIKLNLLDTNLGCAPLAGYAVYLWHCDRSGLYSLYSSGATTVNYLRGIQEADANGQVTFQSIFPACYSGRWPHIHFEIFSSLDAATSATGKVRTSQLALPQAVCEAVYATSGYSASVANLAKVTLASDNVFSDGTSLQIPSVAGSASAGYVATLNVGVAG